MAFEVTWDKWRGSLDGRPAMWIKTICRVGGWTLDLHKFVRADDPGCFHTHSSVAVRLVLFGGYVEELEDGRKFCWRPGAVGLVRPELSHRVSELRNGRCSYSLWLRGPRVSEVELRGNGWPREEL